MNFYPFIFPEKIAKKIIDSDVEDILEGIKKGCVTWHPSKAANWQFAKLIKLSKKGLKVSSIQTTGETEIKINF